MNKYYKCLDCGEITPFSGVPKCKCPNLIIIEEDKDTKVEALNRLHNQLPSNPMNMTVKDIQELEKAQDKINEE